MSGGLDPLPVLPSSPSRQPTGSPRHQQLSSKQQQGLQTMSSQQKPPVSQQSGFSSPIARAASDIKTQPAISTTPPVSTTTAFTGEEERKETAPKLDKGPDPDNRDNKPTQKRGTTESIQTPSKDEKKELQSITKYYEVSHWVIVIYPSFRKL